MKSVSHHNGLMNPNHHQEAIARLQRKQAVSDAKQQRALAHTQYCTTCGTTFDKHRAVSLVRGSFVLEVILWLCFLLPGLAYTIYRNSTKGKGCPACRSRAIILATSPVAKQACGRR